MFGKQCFDCLTFPVSSTQEKYQTNWHFHFCREKGREGALEAAYYLSFCGQAKLYSGKNWEFRKNMITWRHSWQEHIQEEHWRRRRRRRLTRRRQPWCRPLGANSSGSSPWWWTWPAGWSPPRPPWLAPPCSPTRRRTRTPARSWSTGCRWSGCRTTTLELSQCWLKGSCRFL